MECGEGGPEVLRQRINPSNYSKDLPIHKKTHYNVVVEPTHLKNMRKSNWIPFPHLGVKIQNIQNQHLDYIYEPSFKREGIEHLFVSNFKKPDDTTCLRDPPCRCHAVQWYGMVKSRVHSVMSQFRKAEENRLVC